MEEKKIILDDEIIAHSYEFIPRYSKDEIIDSVNNVISKMPQIKSDGYVFNHLIDSFADIYDFSADRCKNFCLNNSITYDTFRLHKWISVLRSNPVQPMELDIENKEPTYHNHKEIALRSGSTIPLFSFVYYLQMPNNLSGIDGHILFKNKNNNVLKYLPKENEILIFNSDMAHAPIHAKNSTKNRIVLAGDFIIEMNHKQNKTLI